ncbi:hypothetical protein BDR05DRAFT_977833 [Suillus weaverae]|nr:hypothetical protein BDR05DRAFT_977833 [Suillus weaverae]
MVIDTDDEDSTPVDFAYNETYSPLRRSHSESFDFEEDNPIALKSQQVTVEDVTDKEDGRRYQQYKECEGEDKWAHFGNEEEWGLAEWLVKSLGQTITDEFLKLLITQNHTKPSFHNNQSFLQKVDALLHGPAWNCKKVSIKGNQTDENGQLLQEDLELWTHNPVECIKELIGNPLFKSRHLPSHQKELPEGATIAPIILASDKTMLSQFQGDKSAWPVYLSISSIAKEKQHQTSTCATVLIGYLPATKLDCFTSDALYPILATYVADFPKQCLIACCKENRCPKCLVAANECGDPLNSLMRDPELTKEILERWRSGQHPTEYGLRLAIPDYPGLCHFKKGISSIEQWTGIEHKEMQCVFMALITGAVPSQVVIVTWALLDFCHYAQLHTHMSDSLAALENALAIFHTHKDVLQELTVCEHFNIPKLHQLSHYVLSIELFRVADGFNTELPERLHINFTKEAYHASNKQDYEEQMALWLQCQEATFCRIAYLEWVAAHVTRWTEHESEYNSDSDAKNKGLDVAPVVSQHIVHVLAKNAPHPQQSVQHLETMHGTINFLPALKSFLQKHLSHNQIVPGPQDRFDIFRQVIIILPPNPCVSELPKCLQNLAVIHVDEIICPCHLMPKMGQSVNPTWTSVNVYELASEFYLNTYIDLETFCMSTTST